MVVETNYEKGCVEIKRNDKIEKSFEFKDFVSARQFNPIDKLRKELMDLTTSKKKIDPEELEAKNIDFFNRVSEVALKEKLDYEQALDIMTVGEIGHFAEELLIFLVNWSSIEAVKQFGKQSQETLKKEGKP